jgi:hypothetical protein
MNNIHVLPTDKSSRLHTYKGILNLAVSEFVAPTIVKNDLINLNIYITSDEEIKEGDWCVDTYKLKNNHNSIFKWSDKFKVDAKKIILTTDQELIKDGVQAIDDEFLQWFVKNPSCEFVKIIDDIECLPMPNIHIHKYIYKIIIPQEEPKQENCCTPVNQIKRYVDCIGCDRKAKQITKPTAVEWLVEQILKEKGLVDLDIEQAKEMEKKQITEAFDECGNWQDKYSDSEQYYNETYKKEEK